EHVFGMTEFREIFDTIDKLAEHASAQPHEKARTSWEQGIPDSIREKLTPRERANLAEAGHLFAQLWLVPGSSVFCQVIASGLCVAVESVMDRTLAQEFHGQFRDRTPSQTIFGYISDGLGSAHTT